MASVAPHEFLRLPRAPAGYSPRYFACPGRPLVIPRLTSLAPGPRWLFPAFWCDWVNVRVRDQDRGSAALIRVHESRMGLEATSAGFPLSLSGAAVCSQVRKTKQGADRGTVRPRVEPITAALGWSL